MPNHIINEVIFDGVNASEQAEIIKLVRNEKGEIDFGVLVPKPLNLWDSSCNQTHEAKFQQTGMGWARENWGTKWNAYGFDQGLKYKSIAQTDTTLTLTFQTANGAPYPWLAAIFNATRRSFNHNWMDEGALRGVEGMFNWAGYENGFGVGWQESEASDEMQRHLHMLLWGVEEFDEEDA